MGALAHTWPAPRGLGCRHGARSRRLRGLQPRPPCLCRHARLRRVHAVLFVSPLVAVLGAPLHAGGTVWGPVSRIEGQPRWWCHAARAAASRPLLVALHPPAWRRRKGRTGLSPGHAGGGGESIGTHPTTPLPAAPGAASIARL